MPGYEDDLPLFSRAGAWSEGTQCYELPHGAVISPMAQVSIVHILDASFEQGFEFGVNRGQ